MASIRALGGSRAAKWAPRKGAPKEEEEEEGAGGGGGDGGGGGRGRRKRRPEVRGAYNTIHYLLPQPSFRLTHLSAGNLLVALGYHSAATRGATLRLPTSGPGFTRGAVTLLHVRQGYFKTSHAVPARDPLFTGTFGSRRIRPARSRGFCVFQFHEHF